MSTYTLTINENTNSGKQMLAKLKSLNLDLQKVSDKKIKRDLTEQEEYEAFLHTSKVNASKIFSEYL